MFSLNHGIKDVRELVALGALDNTIEDEDVSVSLRLEDKDVLVETLLDVEDAIDLEGHRLARPLRGDLAEPAICGQASAPVVQEPPRASLYALS